MTTTLDRRTLIAAGATLALPGVARAQTQPTAPLTTWPPREHFMLWPGLPPGAPPRLPATAPSMNGPASRPERWERGIARPHIGVYRPARPNGRAVLAIPGGGYGFVSLENEGINVARSLTPHGITVFVLAYRLPGEGWANRADVPLQDAQRAMRLIRANARRFGIVPEKLGICGFSAGGHLGAILTVGHDDMVYDPIGTADRLSARPAFSGLIYPVVSFRTAGLNSRSSANLLGENPTPAASARHDALSRMRAGMPPLFILHAMDDNTVPVTQSIAAIEAARRFKVPVEAHLLERGGHGFGARFLPADNPGAKWMDWFAAWTALHAK
ncbi:alpha/beta hydrolase [Sphingomonas sp. LT1P40]|uniref:alpha/beta hydrolase n=1 Tax=Alteristakelama amylovorans TaxID=3096166 RepID=UPI002FC7D1EA